MKFIGDLSKNDVEVLKKYSLDRDVLEFGIGGSTMLLHQLAKKVITVETDQNWVDKTSRHIKKLGINSPEFEFVMYNDFKESGAYDMIFVDGTDTLRLEFAIKTWSILKDKGVMLFHDTRRKKDQDNVNALVDYVAKNTTDTFFVTWNDLRSNITVIKKNTNSGANTKFKNLVYEDWNIAENKPKWMVNGENKPNNWIELLP